MVTVGKKLESHLRKKGIRHILVDVAFCKSCGGPVGELFARPVKVSEALRLLEKTAMRRVECMDADGHLLTIDGEQVVLLIANPAIVIEKGASLDAGALLPSDLRMAGIRY